MGAVNETLKNWVLEVQQFTSLSARAIGALFTRPRFPNEMFLQMDVIGVGSLNIVLLTGLFTGMVLALQTALSLETFGAKNYVGRVVSLSMVRELGPVLTALMVAGRVGSGIAAELGSMMVTDQINAMRAMGSDPLRRLVVPRLLAGVVMVPMLTVISDTVGLMGGWLISLLLLKIPGGLYFSSATDALIIEDILGGLIKPLVFGFIISMVGCYMGLSTSGGTQGVGRATTQSVVVCSVMILAANFLLTRIFFAIF
ncbi:ABC transporter permease [bacterium]|nr:ABC transporter permease [bacterium]MCI0604990.1 ABC transporter permease [bacterium]